MATTEPCASACGCTPTEHTDTSTITLPIVWQRLVVDDGTCPRCSATHHEVEHAVDALTAALRPLRIEPTLEVRAIDKHEFHDTQSESNRIWIAGRPLEDWLDAEVGASQCCSVCGDPPPRTIDVDGESYEAIPERLIVKAGLAAASSLLSI